MVCFLHFIRNLDGLETRIGDFCSRLSSGNVTKPDSRFNFRHFRKLPLWLKRHLNTICCGEQSGKIAMSPIRQRFVPFLIGAPQLAVPDLTPSESGSQKD
jgi:hypothetical protein